ncbi:Zinc finger protein [Trichinella papuae]|uniref:Zinc finger protein n=1 Tax=Trichinella papuae TaxID=268474 RepID=A0A0V1MJV8_9BILA|nr:Zinc finger protein [Trichinella papuae]
MGNQWTGCCIEVKSAVRSTCSALLLAIVSRADTLFQCKRQVNFAHFTAFVSCLLIRFGCDVSKWRQMVDRDGRSVGQSVEANNCFYARDAIYLTALLFLFLLLFDIIIFVCLFVCLECLFTGREMTTIVVESSSDVSVEMTPTVVEETKEVSPNTSTIVVEAAAAAESPETVAESPSPPPPMPLLPLSVALPLVALSPMPVDEDELEDEQQSNGDDNADSESPTLVRLPPTPTEDAGSEQRTQHEEAEEEDEVELEELEEEERPNPTNNVDTLTESSETGGVWRVLCEDQVIEFVGQKSAEEDQQVPLPTTSIQTRTCPVCGYQSNCISSLIRHRRVHTTEYPFRCRLCSKTSKWKSNLVRHAAKMHGVRVVSRQRGSNNHSHHNHNHHSHHNHSHNNNNNSSNNNNNNNNNNNSSEASVDSPVDQCPRASSTDDVISMTDGAAVSGIDQPSTSGVGAVSGSQLDNAVSCTTFFQCTDCPYAAKDRQSLRNHMQKHRRARANSGTSSTQQNGNGLLRCRRRRFQSPQTPATDAQPKTAFRCSVCDFSSTNSSSVKKHIACKRSNHTSAYVISFDQTAASCNGESTPTRANDSATEKPPAPAPSPASINGADCTATEEIADASSASTVASTSTPQRQNGAGKSSNNKAASSSKSKSKSKSSTAADESKKSAKKAAAGPAWQCLICDQFFLARDEAVSHLNDQHRMQPYCCLYCDFGSVEESACNEHVGCCHPAAGLMSVIENLAPISNTVRQRSTRRATPCANATLPVQANNDQGPNTQRPEAAAPAPAAVDFCLYPTGVAFDVLPKGTLHWCPPMAGHVATFTFEQLADVFDDFVAIVDAAVDDHRQPSFAEQLRQACAEDGLFHLKIPDPDDCQQQSPVDILLAKAAASVSVATSANAHTNGNSNAGHGAGTANGNGNQHNNNNRQQQNQTNNSNNGSHLESFALTEEEIQMALANGIEPLRTELCKITIEVNGLKRMMWQCRFCPHTSKKRANVRIHEKTHLRAKKGAPHPPPDPDEPPEKILKKDDDCSKN